MPAWRYRIVNVFAESTFGGNPLCVFEDGRGLSSEQMQLIARQFNLSETTFLLPADAGSDADARVRIFTTGFEMPFAGHPTLGSAHVLRAMMLRDGRVPRSPAGVGLQMIAGAVPVVAEGDRWTLTAPSSGAPRVRAEPAGRQVFARLFGLSDADVADEPVWVDTGSQQLLLRLTRPDAVRRARVSGSLDAWPTSDSGRRLAYLFAFGEEGAAANASIAPASGATADAPQPVLSRFFAVSNGAVFEDPGTGSACANLGGWLIAIAGVRAGHYRITQGESIDRPCSLALQVSPEGAIRVGGRVVELGQGEIVL